MTFRLSTAVAAAVTALAAAGSLQAQQPAIPTLGVAWESAGAIRLSWPVAASNFTLEETSSLDATNPWSPVAASPTTENNQLTVSLRPSDALRFYRLRQAAAISTFSITRHTPLDGAGEVGVTFRPQVFFSEPVKPATLSGANFFATAAGVVLETTIVPANDGTFAWLFFKQNMPGGTRVRVTVDGATITSARDGSSLDADDDGLPGGIREFEFTTVSVQPLVGTSLSGVVVDPGPDLIPRSDDDLQAGLDGRLGTADDVFLLPIAGVKVRLIGQESQVITTQADGRFRFEAVPVGDVKIVIDGNTATQPLAGMYFPEMVIDAQMELSKENWSMVNGPEVYLPRLSKAILQTVSATTTNQIRTTPEGAPALSAFQRSQLSIELAPNSLIGADGRPVSSGQLGISTVPAEVVRDMLPPGVLQHTFDITVQAPGIAAFSTPAPMTFPNVFNAAPGTKLNFLSFDHTTGRLVIEGTATVSADGTSVRTDPGTGITHPGWHGLTAPGAPNDPPDPPDPECEPELMAADEADDAESSGIGLQNLSGRSLLGLAPETEGIEDHFFKAGDGESFTLRFRHPGAAPARRPKSVCGPDSAGPKPLVFKISIEGNTGTNRFLEGLDKFVVRPFILRAGEEKQIRATLTPLLKQIRKIETDRLYGARLRIKSWESGSPNTLLLDKTIYIGRYLDAADASHTDGVLSMAPTAVGHDGVHGAVRERAFEQRGVPLRLRTPASAGDSPLFILGQQINFAPAGRGPASSVDAEVLTPANGILGRLKIEGEAKLQEYFVDGARIREVLAKAASGQIAGVTDGQKAFLNASGALDRIVSRVLADTDALLLPYSSGVARAAADTSGGVRITAYSTEQAAHPEKVEGDTLGNSTDGIDICPMDSVVCGRDAAKPLSELLSLLPKISRAEAAFRLAKTLNSRSQAGFEMYIDHFLTAKRKSGPQAGLPYLVSEDALVLHLATTIVHELGHTLGLVHTYNSFVARTTLTCGCALTPKNKPLPDYRTDIMAHGEVLGASVFTASGPAFEVALGLDYVPGEAMLAYRYYEANLRGAKKIGASSFLMGFDGAPDGNELVQLTEAPGSLIVYSGEDDPVIESAFDFGRITADGPGGSSTNRTFYLSNNGDQDVTLLSMRLSGSGTNGFIVPALADGTKIAAPDVLPFVVAFDPTQSGPAAATLELVHDGVQASTEIDLAGFGVSPGPDIQITVENNNVGGARVGAGPLLLRQFATITNMGSSELVITSITAGAGGDDPSFSLLGLTPDPSAGTPIRLKPAESLNVGLAFAPAVTGLQRGELQFVSNDPDTPVFHLRVVGTGLAAEGSSLEYGNDFAAMETPDAPNTPVLRGLSDAQGHFTFFLLPDQRYHYAIFDPVSGLIAHGVGVTAASGQNTPLGVPTFLPSLAPDSDGDGLPDDIEFAVGSDAHKIDTNGDGVDDFLSVQSGDPLSGGNARTGIIAQTAFEDARHVVVLPNASGDGRLAYVAAGAAGLAIVDVTRPSQPVVTGRLVLRGQSAFVSVDPTWQVAAVATDSAIHLVDVADPGAPKLIQSFTANAASPVAAVDGYVYFEANYGKLYALNSRSGIVEQELALVGNYFTSLVREGDFLYVMDSNSLVGIVEFHGALMQLRGSFQAAPGAGALFVANGIAYVPVTSSVDPATGRQVVGGYSTYDLSDPDKPVLISNSSVPAGTGASGTALAVSSSGFGLLVGPAPVVGNVADLLDVSDAKNTYSFVTRFFLPARPNSVTIASGMGFIAAGSSGLLILNYQPSDLGGRPPALAISGVFADSAPAKAAAELVEGSRFRVLAKVTDDAQVRAVDLLVNGQAVKTSSSLPWDLDGFAPNIAGGTNTFTVQVRATDTGGNVGLSPVTIIRLLPDTVAPVLLNSDPAEGDEKFRGLDSIRLFLSEPLGAASLAPANFELVHESGSVTQPIGFGLRDLNRELELKIPPLNVPGKYRLIIHAASLADGAGNALGRADVARAFTVLRYSIRWSSPAAGSWHTSTNWIPQRLPKSTDWVYIGRTPDTNAFVSMINRAPLTFGAPELQKIRVRGLESELDVVLFYSELQVDESFLANGSLYLAASKLTGTLLVAGPSFKLGYSNGFADPFVTKEGYASVLESVKVRGDVQLTTAYHILTSLTLEGNMHGRLNRNINATGTLAATRDMTIQGPGTFHDVPLNALAGELNDLTRPGPLVTIGADVTFRGALAMAMEGNSARIINRGKLLADEPLPFAFGRFYSTISMTGATATNQSLVNEGTIEASNGYRLLIDGPYNTLLTNRGILRSSDRSFLWLNVPLIAPKVICDAGGTVRLSGRNQPWITGAGAVSELSGPGRWFASESEFQGGTVRLTDGAILEGAATFNDLIFEGELHNYDWNTRQRELPDFLTGYGPQVQAGTNLTLNGLIVFHRRSAQENGGSLLLLGPQTKLDGKGRVEFENSSKYNQLLGSGVGDASGLLTIGPNITIHGKGLTIGKIPGVNSGPLPYVENQGTILTAPGDSLYFGTYGFTNAGIIHIAGTNVVNAQFNFAQTGTGRLEFEASATAAGRVSGKLASAGNATVDGALTLSPAGPFEPVAGDFFELLSSPALLGRFTTVQAPAAPAGLQLVPTYTAKNFRVEVRPAE